MDTHDIISLYYVVGTNKIRIYTPNIRARISSEESTCLSSEMVLCCKPAKGIENRKQFFFWEDNAASKVERQQ